MKSTAIVSTAFVCLSAATPTTLTKRADICEQWGNVISGDFTVYNNLWNQAAASSGQQCLSVGASSSGTLSWTAKWTWIGGTAQVKSYPNAVHNPSKKNPKSISTITSMPSSWKWSYESDPKTPLIADVAYDLFTSSSPTGKVEFEIMIWLAAIGGAGPISSTYGADGKATSIGSVTVGGVLFDLFKGPNGQMQVFSFVVSPNNKVPMVKSFSADLKEFFVDLVTNHGFVEKSQYLISAGAGTEPFEGSGAVFKTEAYKLDVV